MPLQALEALSDCNQFPVAKTGDLDPPCRLRMESIFWISRSCERFEHSIFAGITQKSSRASPKEGLTKPYVFMVAATISTLPEQVSERVLSGMRSSGALVIPANVISTCLTLKWFFRLENSCGLRVFRCALKLPLTLEVWDPIRPAFFARVTLEWSPQRRSLYSAGPKKWGVSSAT